MITSRIRLMALIFVCLASACGSKQDEERDPHGTIKQSGDLGANPSTSGRLPNRDTSGANPTSPTSPTPIPDRAKTALFFQPNNLTTSETCIQSQLLQQSPDKLTSGTVRGPLNLIQGAGGKKSSATAQFTGKGDQDKDYSYTLTFRTQDPRGWTKQIRNLYVGAYSYGMDTKVEVMSNGASSPLFTLDISSCTSGS